jgi:hypothetical protein
MTTAYKRWVNSPQGRAIKRACNARYEKTSKGKMAQKRYRGSSKRRAAITRYNQSKKGKETHRQYRRRLRLTVLTHYCNGTPRCMCACGCRVAAQEILQFDHVNNDGHKFKKNGGAQQSHLIWLRRHHFPPVIRVVCPNCHASRHAGIKCPAR